MYGGMALIMYYGSYLCKEEEITVGAVSAFLLYMILLIFDFVIIGFVLMGFYKMVGAASKIVKLMKQIAGVNSHGGITIDDGMCQGEIELKNVKF